MISVSGNATIDSPWIAVIWWILDQFTVNNLSSLNDMDSVGSFFISSDINNTRSANWSNWDLFWVLFWVHLEIYWMTEKISRRLKKISQTTQFRLWSKSSSPLESLLFIVVPLWNGRFIALIYVYILLLCARRCRNPVFPDAVTSFFGYSWDIENCSSIDLMVELQANPHFCREN